MFEFPNLGFEENTLLFTQFTLT
uniref:Uncharacterized protein n=1 Tax=Anguilla anguilla TaxID=7936 RepID=A0A0E9Q148_ANGAN